MNAVLRIAANLAITCFMAGVVLGAAYYFAEPVRQASMVKSEAQLVRKLLGLGEGSEVTEVRRYIRRTPQLRFGYLLPGELQIVDGSGKPDRMIPVPAALLGKSAEDRDHWVGEEGGGDYAGRFFVGKAGGKVAGYVTESSRYGFKSPIRFFVALTPGFQIRGVEVVSHEEDPGLGAEITRPPFKNQFTGRKADALPTLTVTKDPLPEDRRRVLLAREKMPFDAWVRQYGAPAAPVYAVTGATISSRALTEGVKEAVAHLEYRLGIMQPSSPPQGGSLSSGGPVLDSR